MELKFTDMREVSNVKYAKILSNVRARVDGVERIILKEGDCEMLSVPLFDLLFANGACVEITNGQT